MLRGSQFEDAYRIIDWFGLEGTLKVITVRSPCHGQGHLLLDQGAQSPMKPGLVDEQL